MPYSRPGPGRYVTAGAAVNHGAPATDEEAVGVAVKQLARGWKDGVANQAVIDSGERYFLITKGVVQVPFVAGFAVGDDIWIDPDDNTLTETTTDNLKFGRVVEVVASGRGVPTGYCRIDLDAKDSF